MSTAEEAIPPQSLPLSTRAPGKCILFGEHAVVHGAPELVLTLDLETQLLLRPSETVALNSDRDAVRENPYFREGLARAWPDGPPLAVRSVSRIPRGAGLGSSAAFAAALVAGLAAARGGVPRPLLAQRAFEVERAAQGVGSPGDTSASVAGGYVALNGGSGEPLWSVNAGEQRWEVRRVPDPGWVWVVAHSGVRRATGEQVRSVGRRLGSADGTALLERFRRVAHDGIEAVAREDRAAVAELMRENQELLRAVGVSHPRLEALLEAAAPASEAAKITGAGGGGSIVVLPVPGREVDLTRRLARAGGLPFVVRPGNRGASLVDSAPPA